MRPRYVILIALMLMLIAVRAHAVTFTVNSTADMVDKSLGSGVCQVNPSAACTTDADCTNADGPGRCNLCNIGRTAPPASTTPECTLRAAIQEANARPISEASTINVPAGDYVLSQLSSCTYKNRGNPNFFTSSQVPLCVAKNVSIQGAGAATTVIDGDEVDRVLFVSADATAQISGVTIRNGDLRAGLSFGSTVGGGGINNQGTLTLTESAVTDSRAGSGGGGGIHNAGTLTVLRSTVSRNSQVPNLGTGGGIFNGQQAALTVADSTISNNIAERNGGGIDNFQGTVTITGSTISSNSLNTATNSLGGGIVTLGGNFPGLVTITNSTISSNASGSSGGGIHNGSFSTVHLNNVTITNNTGGPGGVSNGGVLTLQNTVIAGKVVEAGEPLGTKSHRLTV